MSSRFDFPRCLARGMVSWSKTIGDRIAMLQESFRITTCGLTVDFRFVGKDSQQYEYSCNQEGGSAASLVRDFNEKLAPKGWEIIFVYRVGPKGAENSGVYTRFLMRREISQKKFRYHYRYRKPTASKSPKPKHWKKICRIPAHEGWGDAHPYDLYKEEK